jgi:hypothetical protein
MPGVRPVMIMSDTGDQWVLVDGTGMTEVFPLRFALSGRGAIHPTIGRDSSA